MHIAEQNGWPSFPRLRLFRTLGRGLIWSNGFRE
jgi:hypothetical protein